MPTDNQSLLDVTQAVAILPVSRPKLLDMAKKGELPFIRIGNKFYFERSEVEKVRQYGTLPKQDPVIGDNHV
jgi:excisionase family DNA binding protein